MREREVHPASIASFMVVASSFKCDNGRRDQGLDMAVEAAAANKGNSELPRNGRIKERYGHSFDGVPTGDI